MNAQAFKAGAVIEVPVSHHMAHRLYAKEVRIEEVGAKLVQHKHTYSHLSVLSRGAVRLTFIDSGESHDLVGPCCIVIEANRNHGIEALTSDVVWYCIHNVPEEFDGDDNVMIKKE